MRSRRTLVLGALLALARPAAAETPAGEPAIPVPDIVAHAEEVRGQLGAIATELADEPVLAELEARLPILRRRVRDRLEQTRALLAGEPTLPTLDQLRAPGRMLDLALGTASRLLTERATGLEARLKLLDELRSTWKATQTEAAAAGPPPETLARIETALAAIAEVRRQVEARRDQLLVLQDSLAKAHARVADADAQLEGARREAVSDVFTRERQPIWSRKPGRESWNDVGPQLRRLVAAERGALRAHVAEHGGRLLLLAALVVALGLGLRRARDLLVQREDGAARPGLRVLEVPYSCALILALVLAKVANVASIEETQVVPAVGAALVVVPILRVLRRILDPALLPVAYGLAGAFLLDRVRRLLASAPFLEQALFLTELAGLALYFAVLVRRPPPGGPVGRAPRLARLSARALLAVAVLALGAGAAGYMRLAQLLHVGLVGSAINAILLLAVVRVLDAVAAYLLATRPLRLSRFVQRHRWTVHRVVVRALGGAAVLAWAASTLASVALLDPALGLVRAVLGARFTQGELSVSVGDVLFLGLAVWLTWAAASTVRAVLEEDLLPRARLPRGVPTLIASLAYYVSLLAGLLLALAGVGIDVGKVAIFAGALGVGVGIGLQNVVNNFVCGLILLVERPVQVGDFVRVGGLDGEMRRIGIRSSTLHTFDGAEVIVPNANLISNEVVNWTLTDRMRRIDLPVSVVYGTSPPRVLELLQAIAKAQPLIVDTPPLAALFLGFGDTGLNFELRCWTDRFEHAGAIRSELAVALEQGLREAGIAVPFPQHVVRPRT